MRIFNLMSSIDHEFKAVRQDTCTQAAQGEDILDQIGIRSVLKQWKELVIFN